MKDLVAVALACNFRPEPSRPLCRRAAWAKRNRSRLTAYKRQWRAAKRAEGKRPT